MFAPLGFSAFGQELRSYYIYCDESQFEYLLTHPEENTPVDCSFEYEYQLWSDAVIFLREAPYQNFPKKSFKIDFDDSTPFLERDVMNLMAEWNDPTLCRQYLAYDLFNRAGLPSPLAWFARLYVNDVYMGLYLDVEEVDEQFLFRTVIQQDASIYRADSAGCLLTPYEPVEELWVKETNEPTGYYDLENLIMWLNTVFDSLFFTELGDHFQPLELAQAIAVNALLGNRSTYYDNYILIHDLGQDGYWRMVPWNADSTLEYWPDYDDPQYYRSGHQSLLHTNSLITHCWRHVDMRCLIFDQMVWLMDNLFTESYYQEITDTLAALLYDAVREDTNKQFSLFEFLVGLEEIPADVVGRSADLEYRMEHEPLPFNLKTTILTPACVYFSWEPTIIADGSRVTYGIKISNDPLFSGYVININADTNTSLLYNNLLPGQYYWRAYAESPYHESTQSIAFFNEVEVPEGAFSGTVVNENITSSITWDIEGSPYSLPNGVRIETGAVLTIEPGVLVGLGARQSIIVEGRLDAVGTIDDSIRFVPLNPVSNWGAFIAAQNSEANLGFVYLTGGSVDSVHSILLPLSTIQVGWGGELNIFDSHLNGGSGYIGVRGYYGIIHFERVAMDHFYNMIGAHHGSTITRSCSFSFCEYELLDIEQTSLTNEVINCSFYGDSGDAIDLDGVGNCQISGNYITGFPDKGISLGSYSENISIFNNIITNCEIGIAVKTSCSAVLFNNLISLNNYGLRMSDDGSGGEAEIRNTVLWGNNTEISVDPNANLNVEYSLVQGTTVFPGQGNINSDPQFIDLWNENFYPQANSPMIDAGYGTGHPEFDFIDSGRVDIPEIPNTGAGEIAYVDMGVYEYYQPASAAVQATAPVPETHLLLDNFPNPFNGVTRIDFTMGRTGWAEIEIYNILGRLVFSRSFERLSPGKYSMLWNCRNNNGTPVASGMYFCRLEVEHGVRMKKMVLLK